MKKINLKKFRASYSKIIHEVAYINERYIVCKLNEPMAVIISHEDWLLISKMFKEIKANSNKKIDRNFLEVLSFPEILE